MAAGSPLPHKTWLWRRLLNAQELGRWPPWGWVISIQPSQAVSVTTVEGAHGQESSHIPAEESNWNWDQVLWNYCFRGVNWGPALFPSVTGYFLWFVSSSTSKRRQRLGSSSTAMVLKPWPAWASVCSQSTPCWASLVLRCRCCYTHRANHTARELELCNNVNKPLQTPRSSILHMRTLTSG